MRRMVAVVALAVLVVLTGSEAMAQLGMKWRGSEGWGPGGAYGRMYDPTTVVTMKGDVVSIESFESKGISPGVHLTLTTAQETLSVHLGPEWYISGQDTRLAPGDSIEVTGSRITFEGKPVIIASKITKGAEVLLLRDDAGFPAWVDWRRHK